MHVVPRRPGPASESPIEHTGGQNHEEPDLARIQRNHEPRDRLLRCAASPSEKAIHRAERTTYPPTMRSSLERKKSFMAVGIESSTVGPEMATSLLAPMATPCRRTHGGAWMAKPISPCAVRGRLVWNHVGLVTSPCLSEPHPCSSASNAARHRPAFNHRSMAEAYRPSPGVWRPLQIAQKRFRPPHPATAGRRRGRNRPASSVSI